MLPPQLLDHNEHFLPRHDAFALQQFHQRRDLSHVGESQLFEGDEAFRVEFIAARSHDE